MIIRWAIGLGSALLLATGCAQFRVAEMTLPEKERLFGPNVPRVVSSYAQDKMLYPYPWTIFLEAEDPDGDMTHIGAWVKVSGGQLEFATVPLRRDFKRKVKGYVWLPLSRGRGHDFNTITLELYIKDRAGHQSEIKTLQLHLGEQLSKDESGTIRAFEKEYPVALGPINVHLVFIEGDATGVGARGGED